MKKLISLVLLCSMAMGMYAVEVGSADAEKCCNSCNTCPTTTTTCCNSCCKTMLTEEEVAAGEQRCTTCSAKPRPGRSEVGDSADAEKCCNSCNTCPTTTCNTCNSCGCKTVLTPEEEAAGEQRCPGGCGKPRPNGRAEVGDADAEKCCNSCNTCPTTTCNTCNSCGCKTVLTPEEEAAGEQRCTGGCGKPRPGRAVAKVAVAQAMQETN
jgi:hypothetical protein